MKTLKDFKAAYLLFKIVLTTLGLISSQSHARDPMPVVVMSEGLHLRQGPDGGSQSLGVYTQGSQVMLLDYDTEWLKVSVNGQTGYMSRHHITSVAKYERALPHYNLPPIQAPNLLPGSAPTFISSTPAPVALTSPPQVQAPRLVPPAELPTAAPTNTADEPRVQMPSVMRVKATGLHLRSFNYATSGSMGIYSQGTEVQVLSGHPDMEWVKVSVNGQEGFMHQRFLEPVVGATTPNASTVALQPDSSLTPASTEQPAFVPPANIPNASRTMFVDSANGLNLRQSADVNSSKVATLPHNTQIEVLSVTNGWAHVRTPQGEGYMYAEHLTDTRSQETPAPAPQYANGQCVDSFNPQNASELALLEDVQSRIFQSSSLRNTNWVGRGSGTGFRFGEAGGRITVTASQLPEEVVAEIADSMGAGPGTMLHNGVKEQIRTAVSEGSISFNTRICFEGGKFLARLVGAAGGATEGQSGYFELSPAQGGGVSMQGQLAESEIRRETYVTQ